ncbi:post-GPI attachment to proteins factor 2-like [Parasteatoda tepidariorum]|uniref:post-GPI attachment to proteins factor 2-like n=1 Tax=Parasteatoda tepidariorum TaxID=114398 RepID=UPI00077F8469|nr:post-GPI attachment to proteins factor 2-like [Parasteatoda tepidariorum]
MYPFWRRSQLNFTMVSRMQLKFPTLALYTVSLPLVSFVFCVLWSILYNFERATFTHCHVPNYLPSISASIGSFTPQRHVWQICVAIHSAPRYLVVAMYYSHLCDILYKSAIWQWLASIIFLLQFTEVSSLLGLTFVSSSENFHIHELCFITFMISALSNMLLLYFAMKRGVKHRLTLLERTSLKYKTIFGLTNVTAFLLAVYFYFRHNWYCEATVYTYFAFFEYIVVFSNMAYHMTAYWDFCDHVVSVSSCCSLSVTSKQQAKYLTNDFVVKVA